MKERTRKERNLEVEETQNGELWCENIYKLRVKHETEGILGYIYCDFYQRYYLLTFEVYFN